MWKIHSKKRSINARNNEKYLLNIDAPIAFHIGWEMKLGWAFGVAVATLFCLKILEFILKNYL